MAGKILTQTFRNFERFRGFSGVRQMSGHFISFVRRLAGHSFTVQVTDLPVALTDTELVWRRQRKKLRSAWFQQGAYLLRTNLQEHDPEKLWRQSMQLTEIESVFRTLKSELNLRFIFHRIQSRVEAHILIAFLGYCLWVCLKQKLRSLGGSLTPAQVLHPLKQINEHPEPINNRATARFSIFDEMGTRWVRNNVRYHHARPE